MQSCICQKTECIKFSCKLPYEDRFTSRQRVCKSCTICLSLLCGLRLRFLLVPVEGQHVRTRLIQVACEPPNAHKILCAFERAKGRREALNTYKGIVRVLTKQSTRVYLNVQSHDHLCPKEAMPLCSAGEEDLQVEAIKPIHGLLEGSHVSVSVFCRQHERVREASSRVGDCSTGVGLPVQV